MPATVSTWIAYALDRGAIVPNDAASSTALVRASDYIRLTYGRRIYNFDADNVAVVEATYIAAGMELATPGLFLRANDPAKAGKVLTAVADIEWTILPGAKAGDVVVFVPAIDALLWPLMSVGVG